MFQVKAEIIYNSNIKKNYFEIVLTASQIARNALPGQFVNIKVSDGIEPLLRRPLSIHKISHRSQVTGHRSTAKENIVMLYEVIGKGTEMLAQRKTGEYLDVIGPLGNGFQTPNPEPCTPILVAGGMGTAPLVFLAEKIRARGAGHRVQVLIGAKTKEAILCEKEFKELGCDVKIATDDGSRGFKGYVSELLDRELSAFSFQPSAIYACGPKLLLKEISLLSQKYHIPAQISLEAHLACGIGACMGCVIKVKSQKSPPHYVAEKVKTDDGRRDTEYEYMRVCKEGPVFNAGEIIW